jgi:hypothetical protein
MKRSPPRKSVVEAKQFGTFRTLVSCSPPAIETSGGSLKIEECWIEQMPLVTPLYTPLTNSEYFYVCFSVMRSAEARTENNAFVCVESLPHISSHPGVHNGPIESGERYIYCFSLQSNELHTKKWNVTYKLGPFLADAKSESRKYSLALSWTGQAEKRDTLRLHEILYWSLSIPVYCFVIAPLILVSLLLPLKSQSLNDVLCNILAVTYRLGPYSRPWT